MVESRWIGPPIELTEGAELRKLDLVVLHIFLASDVIVVSRFYEFVGFFIRSPLFYLTVACLPFFIIRAIQKSYITELLIFLFGAIGLVVQILHFSSISRQPPNFNSVAQYYPMFSFIVYPIFLQREHIFKLLSTLYLYSCIYVAVYVLAAMTILLHIMPAGIEESLTQSDPERGARILIIASSTLYCMYYSYFKMIERRSRLHALMLFLAVVALIMSESRLLIVIVACVSILSLILPGRSGVSIFCLAGFIALSGVVLYGMVDPAWNPFVIFGDDTSARIRTEGFDTIRRILQAEPLLGAGISSDDASMVLFTSNPTLSAADLGPLGIWFIFGLTGLVLYCFSVYVQCFCTYYGGCGSVANSKAVQYTGCLIGLFGCLTPTWFNGSLVGLFIAIWLRGVTRRAEANDSQFVPIKQDVFHR